jgi:hypothetical protein
MGSLITLAVMLVVIIWLARNAYSGRGYRGAYLAAALGSFVMSFGCFSIIPSNRDVALARAGKDETQLAGTNALRAIGPPIGLIFAAGCLGGLMGAALYRTPRAPLPPPPVAVVPAPPPEPPPESPPQKRKHTAVLPGTGRGFFVEVAGESFYQPALRTLQTLAGKEPVRVLLYPEPENAHDSNAVAIKTFEGETVGYLTRDDAPRYQQTLLALRERGQVGVCSAQLVGGTDDKPSIGIFLDIEVPTHVAKELGVTYKPVRK